MAGPTEFGTGDNIAINSLAPSTTSSSPTATPVGAPIYVTVWETPVVTTLITMVSPTQTPATCITTFYIRPQRDAGETSTVYRTTISSTRSVHCGGCNISSFTLAYTVGVSLQVQLRSKVLTESTGTRIQTHQNQETHDRALHRMYHQPGRINL